MQHQQRRPSKAVSAPPPLPSSILYRSPDGTTIILDIPRSLEESQVLPGEEPFTQCRIYSSAAPTAPFETPEPAFGLVPEATTSPAAQIANLMTAESLRSVLEALSQDYTGAYCLPRLIAPEPCSQNEQDVEPYVPPAANHLHGSIHHMTPSFLQRAPKFNLIVLDPPWPNRSVRRKSTTAGRYKTASSLSAIRALLCAIPIRAHLHHDNVLVAVWITNKPRIVDLLTAPGGIFEEWGVELVAEWTWLKVTADGQPLFPLNAAWRRPWEKLLVAKRKGRAAPDGLAHKTIVAVPDVHSRKPNLRGLFGDILGPGYTGLELFARGLTAGWWSWGDEVLKFQHPQHWHTQRNH